MSRRYSVVPWIEVSNGCVASATCLLGHFGAGFGTFASAGVGLLAYAGFRVAFGTDATFDDLYAGVEGFDASSTARLLDGARDALARSRGALKGLQGSTQAPLLLEVIGSGERILAEVERQPRKLPSTQRYLGTYLEGIAGASEKYAALRGRGESASIRDQYAALLDGARGDFAEKERALVAADEEDLDIDMTVLGRRMGLMSRPTGDASTKRINQGA